MFRILQLIVILAMFAAAAVSAQQTETPAKPAQQPKPAKPLGPHSPTYPTPAPVANPPATPPAPPVDAGQGAPSVSRGAQYGVIGPAPNFTGNTGTLDPAGYTVGRRVFAAGARNATWHMHTAGQLVFGEAGRGRMQMQGQPIKELGVGESLFIPGGIYHWHGASPTENFTMMYVTMGQSKTSQGEPVTEDVYLGKSRK
jgi:quercetin dioxygenase-like cupin family protein